MASALASTPRQVLITSLHDSFQEAADGFWYPQADGVALVRIEVAGSIYRIYRCRDAECPWVQLVEARIEEFEAPTFATWASQWRLVA